MTRWPIALAVVLTCGILGGSGATARAHTRSQSFSSWAVEDAAGKSGPTVRLTFQVTLLEATRLLRDDDDGASDPDIGTHSLAPALLRHLRSRVRVRAGGIQCAASEPRALRAREGYLRVEWRFACPATGRVEVDNGAFFDVAPSHVHYARVRDAEGDTAEYLFTRTTHRHVIAVPPGAGPPDRGTTVRTYLVLGIEHILIGLDHLAFLLALLVLSRRPRDVVLMVTGFTIGHSLTLSLAVLGLVEPDVVVIEALIGFTIALVAAENVGSTAHASRVVAGVGGAVCAALLVTRVGAGIGLPVTTLLGLSVFSPCYLALSDTPAAAARMRPALTVLFGLIHGFGFASVLMEIGLPGDRMLGALLGFNVGVEIGQLAIVGLLWATGLVVARGLGGEARARGAALLSSGLCALGVFWFVGRGLGV